MNEDLIQVNLKAEVVAEIEESLRKSKLYQSVEEFVSEAIRLRMEQIRREESGHVEESG